MAAACFSSATGRDDWADVFARLEKQNAANIEAYKDALFILCLDQTFEPKSGHTQLDAQMEQVGAAAIIKSALMSKQN